MSDPFIRSQSNLQLGSTRYASGGKAAQPSGTPSDAQVAEQYLRSGGPTGTREKLNNFLSKLETTWQLFNRSSLDSGEGELPKDGSLALLAENESPTPETLKMLRARLKEQATKPDKNSLFEYRSATEKEVSKGAGSEPRTREARRSPQADKAPPKAESSAPRTAAQKPSDHMKATPSQPKPPEKPAPKEAPASSGSESAKKFPTKAQESRELQREQRFEPPRVEQRAVSEQQAKTSKGSILGRKPGSSQQSNAQKPEARSPQAQAKSPSAAGRQQSSAPLGQRRPQLLRQPGNPSGTPTSGSFLGTSHQAKAQLRSSDSSGRPGGAGFTNVTRQAVFSQNVAQVHPKLTKRQVSSQMPIHNSFLDECHEEKTSHSGPIKLSWGSSPKGPKTSAQRLFAHRGRLQFPRQGGNGRALSVPISMAPNSAALASARADVAGRIAGAAIGTLLKDLYEEEDLEKLDEETAVTSLGLILRLGGEFTYEHSTRVLDLALELADEVGVRDKETRKEIKFGTILRDVGEFDILLQGETDKDKRMEEFSGFLAGQDMLRAGLLHDIGKVKIPPEILYKPGKLTEAEYELMKMHPIYGEEIVRPIASLRYLCPTIRGHHERWDGRGYPDGLSGESIPLAARIISVADVFDALAAERPYKRGMEVRKVKVILEEGRGTHFDPFLVDAFLEVISRRYPDAS